MEMQGVYSNFENDVGKEPISRYHERKSSFQAGVLNNIKGGEK
jgi:hypothetical protein